MLDPDWFRVDMEEKLRYKDRVLVILAALCVAALMLGLAVLTVLPWFFM